MPPDSKLLVRVRTTKFMTSRGLSLRKDINFLKRGSRAFNILKDDADHIGADLVIDRIVNLDKVVDGIYEVVMVNKSYEWETGTIDDWNYELIPVT